MNKPHTGFLRTHKNIVVLIFILLAISGVIIGYLVYRQFVVTEMRSLANGFTLDDSWTLKYDIARPPDMCIDIECPSYTKIWDSPMPLSRSQFTDLVVRSADTAPIKTNTCVENDVGNLAVCEKEYDRNGYRIIIRYDNKTVTTGQELSLTVRR